MSRERFRRGSAVKLDRAFVRNEIRRFLLEDVGPGDATTEAVIRPDVRAAGWILARQPCVVAGLDLARVVFEELDGSSRFEPVVSDGDRVAAGARLARVEGRATALLTGERLALNLLQRLSGIATVTRRYVDALSGTGASVSDTRKTTPGLRMRQWHHQK